MFSAVVGTVKSFLEPTVNRERTPIQSPGEPYGDDDRPASSPYHGLRYGYSTNVEEKDAKETSSFSGKVTDLLYGYGLINNDVYFSFDCVVGGQRLSVGASVDVVAVRNHDKGSWKATQVSLSSNWDLDVNDQAVGSPSHQSDALIGVVTKVTQDSGFIEETVTFDQDSLVFGYKPVRGDWIRGDVIYDSDGKPSARNVRPLREQRFSGSVTHVYPGYGHVNGKIYFSFRVCEGGWRPQKGDIVEGKMIESQQSKGNWRAVSMKRDSRTNRFRLGNISDSPLSLCVKEDLKQNKGGITITGCLDIGLTNITNSKSTTACIRNVGCKMQTFTHYEFCCPTGDVTVQISKLATGSPAIGEPGGRSRSPAVTSNENLPLELPSKACVYVTLTIKAKQLGKCLCQVTFHFDSFSICRLWTLNAHDQEVSQLVPEGYSTGSNNRLLRGARRGKMDPSSTNEFGGCIFPGIRPYRNFDVNVPVKLPQYSVPRDLRICLLEDGDLVYTCPQLVESLCLKNFSSRFSALLHLEEIKMELDMREFDMEEVSMKPRGEFLSLEVPGLAEGRPSVLIGDKILVTHQTNTRYDGYIHEVLGDAVLLKFHPSFHELYQAENCSVMFTFSRTPLRRCHQACEFVKNLGSEVLFPTKVEAKPPQVSVAFRRNAPSQYQQPSQCKPKNIVKLVAPKHQTLPTKSPRWNNKITEIPPRFAKQKISPTCDGSTDAKFVTPKIRDVKLSHIAADGNKMAEFINPCLNARQQSAVIRILQGEGRPLPYVIFGPPGTGKTVTVVEAILQVHLHLPSSRILACTPSNSAADLLTERLHESGKVTPTDLVRLNAFHRSEETISEAVRPYCKDGGNLIVISHQRIIVCTCITAGSLYQLGLKSGHFSHVFVDEAGQATEPECLIPVGLAVGSEGQIILAGDPMQLGPVLSSHVAKQYGLGQSYLERLIDRMVYRRDPDKYRDHGCYDPLLVTKLLENYRSHPVLLNLSSCLFYHDELLPRADPKLTHSWTAWEKLPNRDNDCPLVFHGIMGQDMREGSSPSWFNPVEVVQVIRYVQALLNSTSPTISPSDIGIITPYRKQVEKIKLMLVSLGIEGIKVGSVEEFQGQERVAMVISTVRSSDDLIAFDVRHHLGFVSNPKRFNVSITRAQALMIIVGNPHVLTKDKHWRALLRYCIESGAYTGCQLPDLPPEDLDNEDDSLDESPEPDLSSSGQQQPNITDSKIDENSTIGSQWRLEQSFNSVNDMPDSEEGNDENVGNVMTNLQTGDDTSADFDSENGVQTQANIKETAYKSVELDNGAKPDSENGTPLQTKVMETKDMNKTPVICDSSFHRESFDCSKSEATAIDKHIQMTDKTVTKQSADADKLCEMTQITNGSRGLGLHEDAPNLVNRSSEWMSTEQKLCKDREYLTDDTSNHPIENINQCMRLQRNLTSGHSVEMREGSGWEKLSPLCHEKDPFREGFSECRKGTSSAGLRRSILAEKKLRVRSALSFSSSSDVDELEQFKDFIDDDLSEVHQATEPDDKSLLSQRMQGHTQACEISNNIRKDTQPNRSNTEVLWSSGTFSDPEICDHELSVIKSTEQASIHGKFPNDILGASCSKPDKQTLPRNKEEIERQNPINGGNEKPEQQTSKSDSQDGEIGDPEIWDEDYNFSGMSKQLLDHGESKGKRQNQNEELQSQVAEKWDDHTWDIRLPNQDLSVSDCKTTSPTGCLNYEVECLNLGSVASGEKRVERPSLTGDRRSKKLAEAELIKPSQKMPLLEDWSLCTSPSATLPEATKTQWLECHHQLGRNLNKMSTDHSTQHVTPADDTQSEQSKHSSAARLTCSSTYGWGRGRGVLANRPNPGSTPGPSGTKPKVQKSRLKNPWKVGAPTYTVSPSIKTTSVDPLGTPQVHYQSQKHDRVQISRPKLTAQLVKADHESEHDKGILFDENTGTNQVTQDAETVSQASSTHDDDDDWNNSNHPHFFYRRPQITSQKGGKWKYQANSGSRTKRKTYTTDEDFMGDDSPRQGMARTGSYPVAENVEMVEDFDVIIESNSEEEDGGV